LARSTRRSGGTSTRIHLVGDEARGVKTPRNFAIEPTGRIMLVANRSGKSVVSFHINQETGELTPTRNLIEVGSPVCVRFVPLNEVTLSFCRQAKKTPGRCVQAVRHNEPPACPMIAPAVAGKPSPT
jgi:hypothetical protein